jgi:hypothetical protein
MNDLIQGNKQRSRGHTVQYSIQGADHTAVPIDIYNSRKDVWIKKEIVECPTENVTSFESLTTYHELQARPVLPPPPL